MTRAYVLIETAVGTTKDLLGTLRGLPGITGIDAVTGRYDLIATVEGDTIDAIGNLVTSAVHRATGVDKTETLFAVDLK